MADYHKFDKAPEGTPLSNFVHLHVHSDYSLLDSCAKLPALVEKAVKLNMRALALTDHGNMYGALNFEHWCHVNDINPIVGEEFYVAYGSHNEKKDVPYGRNGRHSHYFHLILLCKNETGYKNMSWLSSKAFCDENALYYGKPRIDFDLLKSYHDGLICLSACIQGEIPQLLLNDKDEEAYETAKKYQELFGKDSYYIELQNHGLSDQNYVNPKLIKLAKDLDIPLVVTNDIHYMERDDAEAQDALRCIGFKNLLDKPHATMGEGRSEWYFKNEEEMRQLFPGMDEAYDNTLKIADMCNLTIHQYKTLELRNCLPRFELPVEFQRHGDDYAKNQDDYVRFLVEKGLRMRYKEITPKIRARAEYELGTIFQMGFSGYFLIVWEFINWSKSTYDNVNKRPKPYIPIGPGRGSGAGSLVAYCMTITDIDPFRFSLIFERFLNSERVSMPDFDIDMDFDYRQDIIQHTRDLYGDEQVGHIVTFGTLKPKQVIADVGRVLDIPLSEVNALKACVPDSPKAKLKDAFQVSEKFPEGEGGRLAPYRNDPRYKRLFDIAEKLEGCNRNTGLHASGMVVGLTALPEWAPVFKDPKTGEVGVQYTMDIIEPCGLVKFDYLGLKTLSLIRYAEDIINKHKKEGEERFDCSKVSESDEKTFELFRNGDSVAVFQFESPGMQKILRQFQPEKLEDLVALNALYRPGPMDYIPNYIDGKWKPETIHYPDPCLEPILKETYGVMVYQEQVMQVSQRIAGFSLGEADMLRRAMGKKKPEVLMGKKKEFVEGALKQGFTKEHAEEIFEIMIPFAGYGFNKSHAAAYSVLAYRTGYLKANYPAEFMAANLTNEITSTDTLPVYIAEARRMGITVNPPDVNESDVNFDVIDGKIVFGLRGIKGMGTGAARAIVKERNDHGPYKSFIDFLDRVLFLKDEAPCEEGEGEEKTSSSKLAINKKAVEVLIKTGAFDKLGQTRSTLVLNYEQAIEWENKKHLGADSGQQSLFEEAGIQEFADFKFEDVAEYPAMERLNLEKDLIGCYVSGHPLDEWKSLIEKCATVNSKTIMRAAKDTQAEIDAIKNSSSGRYRSFKNAGKSHVAIGMIKGIRSIMTKKGTQMAFAKLMDYDGEMDITFFPNTWETVKTKIEDGGIYAFQGKADLRVDQDPPSASFIVDQMLEAESLKEKSISECHILLNDQFNSSKDLSEIKNILFGSGGNCSVYLHIDINSKRYIVRTNSQLRVSSSQASANRLKDLAIVDDVWFE